MTTLTSRALSWIADDPDLATRLELQALLDAHDEAALADRFSGPLEFGTAGLRGVLGGGESRMNRVVVQRATAGLCAYLKQTIPNATERGLVLACDGRRMSAVFQRDVAEVAMGAGFRVFTFAGVQPTPMCAFTTLHTGAAAGVMVTASHNPPQYNGYKVYWENGAQIIPPHDTGIAARIAGVRPLKDLPRVAYEDGLARGRCVLLGTPTERAYLDGVHRLLLRPEEKRRIRVVYTALHGVGNRLCMQALAEGGFHQVHSVPHQAEPDGSFPTVPFPNPEEKGAMDLALALAREVDAHLVLANDPDADRLAVAVKDAQGKHVMLTGNDVGCLLAHHLLSHSERAGRRVVINSIVSSPMLGSIAAAHGASFESVLTGFKWIANRALELEKGADPPRFVMGYEEALGYTVGTLVRDKDGIGTAVVMAELADGCEAAGSSVLQELENAWRRYGLYLSRQVSVSMTGQTGMQKMAAIMDAVRKAPPAALGSTKVTAVVDLKEATRKHADGRTEKLALPPSNVIALDLEGGHRVMLRPSGTEPKIKYYFDVRETVVPSESIASARARGESTVDALVKAFLAALPAL